MTVNQFNRTEILIGKDNVQKLHKMHVAVFGVGGVGGFAAEALVRSGIGHLDLIDNDIVSLTNLNRQIIALHSTVGMNKVDVAEQRFKDINPQIIITKHKKFFLPENISDFDFSDYDYIIDAIDTVAGKIALAQIAQERNIPIISAMGAGNKLNPCSFCVTDIYKTKECPLAKVMRKELKARKIKKLKVVYSEEHAITPAVSEENSGKRQTPGSIAFVPSVAGLIMAAEVTKDLIAIHDDKDDD